MFKKIIITFLSVLVLYSCKRFNDKPTTKIEPSEELKVEMIKGEIIENPKNDDVLFVTVNGNRRITLTEISDREVRARFTDLSVEKKLKK